MTLFLKVEIITNDGRVVVGILKGLDQVVNVVLANTEERVFTSEGIDKQQLGLYLIRGDNVAIVGTSDLQQWLHWKSRFCVLSFILGAVDENTELGMDFSTIKAQQLPPILHD